MSAGTQVDGTEFSHARNPAKIGRITCMTQVSAVGLVNLSPNTCLPSVPNNFFDVFQDSHFIPKTLTQIVASPHRECHYRVAKKTTMGILSKVFTPFKLRSITYCMLLCVELLC